jgi:hypothetical protein
MLVSSREPVAQRRRNSMDRWGLAVFGAIVLLGSPLRAAAADGEEHDYQTWLALFAHGPVRGKLWLWNDAALRFTNRFEPVTGMIRPGLSWRVHHTVFLTAGYGWTPLANPSPSPRDWGDLELVDEHRTWQQVLWVPTDAARGITGMIRVRQEQRFRPAYGSTSGHRVRIMWRGMVAIAPRYFIVQANEIFVGFADTGWGQRKGVEQLRVFGGLGWQAIPAKLRLELGYLNQWFTKAEPQRFVHALLLSFFVSWPEPTGRESRRRLAR